MTETRTATRRPRTAKKTAEKKATNATAAPATTPAGPKRPGGKLGRLVERMDTAEGATLAELSTLTGWQPHTVRAALTRLRQRHFEICLEARNGRKAYRLDAPKG